jgi:sulfotransferase famil protein
VEDRYSQLRSFCLVVGADAEAVETVRSSIDAHPAALVTRGLDLFKEGSLRFQKRGRFLRTVTGRLPANEAGDHQLIGVSGGTSTLATLQQSPERLRELGDLVEVPVKVVSALRNPFVEAAAAGAPRVKMRELRARHETLMRIEDHGVEVLHVGFEELLGDVPGELTRLCRFLGLAPEPDYLRACGLRATEDTGLAGERRSLTTKQVRRVRVMVDEFPWLEVYRGASDGEGRPGTESGLTEYFVDDAGRADEPVLVFHHIQKTAGTSLRDLIRANLPPVERETRRYDHFLPMDVLLASFRRDLEEVASKRGAALRCVMSHRANFALPFIERPVEVVTIIREPVDRVVSAHYFSRPRSDPLDTMRRLRAIYTDRAGSQLSPKVASTYYNLQARSLLAPYYDPAELERTRGPASDADLWRERLFTLVSERYTVGLRERLDDFVRALAARFGWEQTELPRKKASSATRPRPAVSDLPEELQELIRDYNWLDLELYEHCSAELYASPTSGGL